jgi:hypothetical protein
MTYLNNGIRMPIQCFSIEKNLEAYLNNNDKVTINFGCVIGAKMLSDADEEEKSKYEKELKEEKDTKVDLDSEASKCESMQDNDIIGHLRDDGNTSEEVSDLEHEHKEASISDSDSDDDLEVTVDKDIKVSFD